MPTITLDEINAAVSARYEPVVIPFGDDKSVSLVPALRLPKEKRQKIVRLQKNVDDMDQSADDALDKIVANIGGILCLAATNQAEAKAFLKVVGDDLAVLTMTLEMYGKATQLPEA